MKSIKPQKVVSIPFVEGGNLQQIPFQFTKAVRSLKLLLTGSITIASTTGTVAPSISSASDGTTLFPYLLELFGKITFEGTPLDSSKGVKINNLPLWIFWLESFIQNSGNAPVVDDGGMLKAGFAPATYQISVAVTIPFFDHMTPPAQHPFTYFRPQRYNKQPYFQIVGGTLFGVGANANQDNIALTGDTATPATLVYTTSLVVFASVELVPDMASNPADQCADISYEYNFQPNLNQSQYNNLALADLEVQQYIHLIDTKLVAVGTGSAMQEVGNMSLGSANNTIIETDFGTDPIAQVYAPNQIQTDIETFLEGPTSTPTSTAGVSLPIWPKGLIVIDEYGHNWSEWQKKTCLAPGLASHFIQGNGVPNSTLGSNFRVIHKTANLSATAKKSVGTFPVFAGQ